MLILFVLFLMIHFFNANFWLFGLSTTVLFLFLFLQDVIPLRGEVNYPNVVITPSVINFGCVPLNNSTYRVAIMRNISPLPVVYFWEWPTEGATWKQIEPEKVTFRLFVLI